MAQIILNLAFLAVLIAAHETTARSAHFSRIGRGHKGSSMALARKPLALLRYLDSRQGTVTAAPADACPAGGLGLTATSSVQSFSLTQYANEMDCSWSITADDGMVVYINIGSYSIENHYMCDYDYLSVASGDGSDVRLCGEGSFSSFSVGTTMDLHFHSDYCVTHNGFTVEYSQVAADLVPQRLSMDTVDTTIELTGDSTHHEVILASHSGSNNYDNNVNVSTTITAPEGMMVSLTVQAFDVESACYCQYDWVTVFNNAGQEMHTWCGADANGLTVNSFDNMTIWWHTDGSVTASGFIFELSVLDPTSLAHYQTPVYEANSCPGPMEISLSGIAQIASPSFGLAQYENEMFCSWLITAADDMFVSVTFTSLELEHHGSCVYDGVDMYDGEGNLLTSVCGDVAPPAFTSPAAQLKIVFRSDGSVTDAGFLVTVEAVAEPIMLPVDPCSSLTPPMLITETETPLSSNTGSDGLYIADSDCRWSIQAPDVTQTVTLTFSSFYLEDSYNCVYDSLNIYNSNDLDPTALIGTYCGSTSPISVTSSGNVMFVQFKTDYCVQYEGFTAMVTFGNDEPTEPQSSGSGSGAGYGPGYGPGAGSGSGFGSGDWGSYASLYDSPGYGPGSGSGSGSGAGSGFGSGDWESLYDSPMWSESPAYLPPTSDPLTGECGVPAIPATISYERVVGGDEAAPNSWPWQISLRSCSGCTNPADTGYHICGGVVLSESWVITAAHCISGSAADYRIVAGDHDRSTHEGTEQTRTISFIQVNSHYSTDGDRDAALLQLASPLHLNDHVSPICLTDTEVPVGTNCVATGWGETESYAESNLVLREVPLPILSDEFCETAYGSYITPYTVCAGYQEGGRDTCQGDSGGPLVCEIDGAWQLHGLTSFGYGCAEAGYPGVYTRVSAIIPWIQSYTNNQFHLLNSTEVVRNVDTVAPRRSPVEGKIVNWNKQEQKSEKVMTESAQLAAWKRELADLSRKGAENSRKLVDFFRNGKLHV